MPDAPPALLGRNFAGGGFYGPDSPRVVSPSPVRLHGDWSRCCCGGKGKGEASPLAEAAARLQQKSRNAYARYEQGQAVPTVEKLEELLRAIAPDQQLIWRLAS